MRKFVGILLAAVTFGLAAPGAFAANGTHHQHQRQHQHHHQHHKHHA